MCEDRYEKTCARIDRRNRETAFKRIDKREEGDGMGKDADYDFRVYRDFKTWMLTDMRYIFFLGAFNVAFRSPISLSQDNSRCSPFNNDINMFNFHY